MAHESYWDEKVPVNDEAGIAHAPFSQLLTMLQSEADWPAVASDSPNASRHYVEMGTALSEDLFAAKHWENK